MELPEFLVQAKINTYASNGENGEEILKDGGRLLVYQEGEWEYKDRYFCSKSFIGEEIVLKNGKIVWGMNYFGGVISNTIESRKVYDFLKKAMRQVKEDKPFRGPQEFNEGLYLYTNKNEGMIDDFSGSETIFLENKIVYQLKYHGGFIK